MSFNDDMIRRVIEREGGDRYTDDPLDQGGATKFGVTQSTLAGHRKAAVTKEDVKTMTLDEARDIYKTLYLVGPGIEQIEDPLLRELLFDSAVQHGPGQAIRFLQRAIPLTNDLIDGVLGPKTLEALKEGQPYRVRRQTWCERAIFYATIVKNKPAQRRFSGGWFNRLAEFVP